MLELGFIMCSTRSGPISCCQLLRVRLKAALFVVYWFTDALLIETLSISVICALVFGLSVIVTLRFFTVYEACDICVADRRNAVKRSTMAAVLAVFPNFYTC